MARGRRARDREVRRKGTDYAERLERQGVGASKGASRVHLKQRGGDGTYLLESLGVVQPSSRLRPWVEGAYSDGGRSDKWL